LIKIQGKIKKIIKHIDGEKIERYDQVICAGEFPKALDYGLREARNRKD
jgi:hypothetical protein